MVGREVILETTKEPREPDDVVLSVDDLRVTDADGIDRVSDVSFDVREGEVFGVAGVDGNGQAEIVESITGMRRPDDGRITFDGDDVTTASRRERIRRGMAYVPEDRQERGLVMDFDLVENSVLGSQHAEPYATDGRLDWTVTREHAADVVSAFDVRPGDVDAPARSLSGGNQQKFLVGREFSRDPALVVAAHPTRGVDVGSIEFIHDRVLDLRRDGKAVLLVSSKLDEVQQLSDRLGVVHDGELVDVVDPDRVTEEQLGLLMAGERPDEVPHVDARADGGERR
jgi:simple sugar transport system ATP-binding protein